MTENAKYLFFDTETTGVPRNYKAPSDAHNAMSDIEATERCFWELKKRGII